MCTFYSLSGSVEWIHLGTDLLVASSPKQSGKLNEFVFVLLLTCGSESYAWHFFVCVCVGGTSKECKQVGLYLYFHPYNYAFYALFV